MSQQAPPAQLAVKSLDGGESGTATLALKVADPAKAKGLVHRHVVRTLQNQRQVSQAPTQGLTTVSSAAILDYAPQKLRESFSNSREVLTRRPELRLLAVEGNHLHKRELEMQGKGQDALHSSQAVELCLGQRYSDFAAMRFHSPVTPHLSKLAEELCWTVISSKDPLLNGGSQSC